MIKKYLIIFLFSDFFCSNAYSENVFEKLRIEFEIISPDKIDLLALNDKLKNECPHLKLLESRTSEPNYSYQIKIGSGKKIYQLVKNANGKIDPKFLESIKARALRRGNKDRYGTYLVTNSDKYGQQSFLSYYNNQAELLSGLFKNICNLPKETKRESFPP